MKDDISGDARLSVGQRLQYLWRNARRNLVRSTNELKAHPWPLPADSYDMARGKPSPLRVLSEAFLVLELPAIIGKTNISVLDIGCGSGRSLNLLVQAGFKGRYVGLDIEDRFAPSNEGKNAFDVSFTCQDVHLGLPEGPFDLILSNSALEHIPDDEGLAQKFNAALSNEGVQVHIVPAPAGLFTYLWHGYRQFSLTTIGQRFDGVNPKLYQLGGLFSFLIHLVLITVPEILLRVSLRNTAQIFYQMCLRSALRFDHLAPILATGYVIVQRKS